MRRNSGELQNFISDKIQIWARVVLKMLLTGIKVQKWSKMAQKRLSYCQIPYLGVLRWFKCFTPLFGHMRSCPRPKKGPVWPINLPFWLNSSKLSWTSHVTYQKFCKKGTKPMKKELAQSDLPVQRKIPKTTQKYCFSEKCNFWVVFGVFLQTDKTDWANAFFIGLVPFSQKF